MKFLKLLIITLTIFIKSFSAQAISQDNSLTILAPTNMSFILTEIIRNYSRKNNINITGSFNSVKNLINNIEEGYPADIIITNHPQWITYLKQHGLINIASINNLVEDKLVLVIEKQNYHLNKEIFTNDELKQKFYKNFTLIIPDQNELSTGKYIAELIAQATFFNPEKTKTIKHQNLNKAFADQENSLMITNYSNTYDNNNINILETFDSKSHQRFIYQIAIIANEDMNEAEKFITYLKSSPILKIFNKYGFETIK